ncbi:MAG TPA: SDR family oxidoreductase [Novosphingobium sp.]
MDQTMLAKVSLEGKTGVVTGGGAGIGRGIARALARAGAAVVIGEVEAERAQEVVRTIAAEGGQAEAVVMDAMDSDQVRVLVEAADRRFGRLDILVNNVGGTSLRPFLEQSERSWRRHIDLNLISLLAATSAAAPIMIRGGRGGSIINVSSIEASRAAPNFAVYAACKAGMENFTRTMALELSEHGIRVNAIAPDHTLTPGIMGNRKGPVDPATWRKRSEAEVDGLLRIIPLAREGTEDECGDAAVFLACDLSAYVTGVVLPVDGGTSASFGWMRNRDGLWTLTEDFDPRMGG